MSRPCKGNSGKLIALMDGSLRPRAADRLRQHLAGCPGCNAAFSRMSRGQQLLREMGQQDEEDLSNISWKRIEAQLHWKLSQDDHKRQPRRRVSPIFALAGAAALGAMIGILVFTQLDLFDQQPGAAPPGVSRVAAKRAAVHEEELAAVVTLARGEVFLRTTRGNKAPLNPDRPLMQGDRVITGEGRLAFQWEQDTGLRMVPRTEVKLDRLGEINQQLALNSGRIYLQVRKRRPEQSFSVVAAGIRATVKGTHLSVGLQDGAVTVSVYTGLVHVAPVDGRWPGVDVPAGKQVAVPPRSTTAPAPVAVSERPEVSLINLQPWTSFQRLMAASAMLTVDSRPSGAELRLDSRVMGSTSIRVRGSFARHLLELYRDGKLVHSQWVELSPNMTKVVLNVPRPRSKVALASGRESEDILSTAQRLERVIGRRCYARLKRAHPDLRGKLTIRLRVDSAGMVSSARLERATHTSKVVWKCARRILQRWRFTSIKNSEVVLPFRLNPASHK